MPLTMLGYVKLLTAMLLMALGLNLTGCATQSPQLKVSSPVLPPPPVLATPQPQEPYSETWRQKVEQWRQRLIATQQTH